MGWDVFISHASEDKAALALPLKEALEQVGISAWIDMEQIKLGDSFRSKIDLGLQHCRFGVVLLSPPFFRKPWAQAELDAIFNMGMSASGQKRLLPVVCGLTFEELQARSPLLAGLRAVRWEDGLAKVVRAIAEVTGAAPAIATNPPPRRPPAAPFLDRFATGVNPNYWTYRHDNDSASPFIKDDTHGNVTISKAPGGQLFPKAYADLNFGPQAEGNFNVSVTFSHVALSSFQSGNNDLCLFAEFGPNGSVWAIRRGGPAGNHWANWYTFPEPQPPDQDRPCPGNAGTLSISRNNGTIEIHIMDINGNEVVSHVCETHYYGPATFGIRLLNNGTTDAARATFDSFSLTADEISGIPRPCPTRHS